MINRTKAFFIHHKEVFFICISIILILISLLFFIGFFYTSFFVDGMIYPTNPINKTFYLYENTIYAPVTVTVDSKIAIDEIPYYIGSPYAEISDITFQKPFVGYSLKGELLGQAEADFLYDTEENMNTVNLYTVLSENNEPISGILWAESDAGEDSLVVEIVKPYSRKMLRKSQWKEYAVDLFLTMEAKSGGVWSRQFGIRPGNSVYYEKIDDSTLFRFKENLYFFYYDVFG